MPRLTASLLAIGDELLDGSVEDRNARWLCERLAGIGVPVADIVFVGDDRERIDARLREAVDRVRPGVVLTTGGLGFTDDDVTRVSIAKLVGADLRVDEEVLERLEEMHRWARSHGLEVTRRTEDAMRRLATLPEGCTWLRHPNQWTYGIRADLGGGLRDDAGVTLFVLPGIPGEVRGLFTAEVDRELRSAVGQPPATAEITHGLPESLLLEALDEAQERYPLARIGSYPGRPMRLRVTGQADAVAGATDLLRSRVFDLQGTPEVRGLAVDWASRVGASPSIGVGVPDGVGRLPDGRGWSIEEVLDFEVEATTRQLAPDAMVDRFLQTALGSAAVGVARVDGAVAGVFAVVEPVFGLTDDAVLCVIARPDLPREVTDAVLGTAAEVSRSVSRHGLLVRGDAVSDADVLAAHGFSPSGAVQVDGDGAATIWRLGF